MNTSYKKILSFVCLTLLPGFNHAGERQILNDNGITVSLDEQFVCGPAVRVNVNASNALFFNRELESLQRIIGGFRAVMGFECPEGIDKIAIAGVVQQSVVFQGEANKDNGWRLNVLPAPLEIEGIKLWDMDVSNIKSLFEIIPRFDSYKDIPGIRDTAQYSKYAEEASKFIAAYASVNPNGIHDYLAATSLSSDAPAVAALPGEVISAKSGDGKADFGGRYQEIEDVFWIFAPERMEQLEITRRKVVAKLSGQPEILESEIISNPVGSELVSEAEAVTEENAETVVSKAPTNDLPEVAELDFYSRECANFAAHPDDENKISGLDGVSDESIDVDAAIQVCIEALEVSPEVISNHFHLGRALYIGEYYEEAVDFLTVAADDEYAAAQFYLARLYYEGSGDADDEVLDVVEALLISSSEAGFAPSASWIGSLADPSDQSFDEESIDVATLEGNPEDYINAEDCFELNRYCLGYKIKEIVDREFAVQKPDAHPTWYDPKRLPRLQMIIEAYVKSDISLDTLLDFARRIPADQNQGKNRLQFLAQLWFFGGNAEAREEFLALLEIYRTNSSWSWEHSQFNKFRTILELSKYAAINGDLEGSDTYYAEYAKRARGASDQPSAARVFYATELLKKGRSNEALKLVEPAASKFSGRYADSWDSRGQIGLQLEVLEFVFYLGRNGMVDEGLKFIDKVNPRQPEGQERKYFMHEIMKIYLGVGARDHELVGNHSFRSGYGGSGHTNTEEVYGLRCISKWYADKILYEVTENAPAATGRCAKRIAEDTGDVKIASLAEERMVDYILKKLPPPYVQESFSRHIAVAHAHAGDKISAWLSYKSLPASDTNENYRRLDTLLELLEIENKLLWAYP